MYVYWPVSDFHSAAQTQAAAGQGTFFFLLIKNLGIIGACGWANWHALDEPDRWTTKALRCDTKSMLQLSKPAAVGARDIYTVVRRPGSALWNPQATPHWVETFSEPALTLTLVHAGLRLHGRLCPHEQEREDELLTVRVPSLAAAGLLSSRSSERARY